MCLCLRHSYCLVALAALVCLVAGSGLAGGGLQNCKNVCLCSRWPPAGKSAAPIPKGGEASVLLHALRHYNSGLKMENMPLMHRPSHHHQKEKPVPHALCAELTGPLTKMDSAVWSRAMMGAETGAPSHSQSGLREANICPPPMSLWCSSAQAPETPARISADALTVEPGTLSQFRLSHLIIDQAVVGNRRG